MGNDLVNRAEEEIVKMRKEFSANVSHELKTPLTSISGYAEIMKSGMVNREDMIVFSERIYKEASRMIALIDDIIKLSKLDEDSVEVEWQDVDLYALCEDIVERLTMSARKRDVQVELDGEPVVYYGVKQMLDEMIFNLCENAIKYNVPDGKVILWVGNTPEGVKIIVQDTGIGIPKDQQERVFERFYRVDKSHSKKTGGTGLGLSIVKHAAIYHHAQIRVESEVGKGTKMEVVF
jgi:two-component system phosphate regulon sensor histidine kinase PhoR